MMTTLLIAAALGFRHLPARELGITHVVTLDEARRDEGSDRELSYVGKFFEPCETCSMTLNPAGDLVAVLEYPRGGADERASAYVSIISVRAQLQYRVGRIDRPEQLWHLDWSGDRTLMLTIHDGNSKTRVVVMRIRDSDGEVVEAPWCKIDRAGYFVHSLPGDEDHVLFAFANEREEWHYHLARLDVSHCDGIAAQLTPANRLNRRFSKGALGWLADPQGRVRAAVTIEGDEVAMWRGQSADGEFERVATFVKGDSLSVEAFTGDGERLVALSNKGRDTVAAFELDPTTGHLGKELYSLPDRDLDGAIINAADGALIGFTYTSRGRRESHLIDSALASTQRTLDATFPGKSVSVLGYDRSRNRYLVLVGGPTDPGSFYLLDQREKSATLLARVRQNLVELPLSEPTVLTVKSPAGLTLDARLTLPSGVAGKPPLVVMPHGGPVHIQDDVDFDPSVQFLASRGMAVLTVDYRGSGGRGRRFADAGKKQWGKGIEDDIDAAVDDVVARGLVDPARICIAGSSYGGYSALMGIIRRPERYRCAASYAGTTDLPLWLTEGTAATEAGRRARIEVLGDPRTDAAALVAASPVYQYRKLTRPLLIAHGVHDSRVSVEHALRLRMMLGEGPQRQWLFYDGGHAYTAPAHYFLRVARLVEQALGLDASGWLARMTALEGKIVERKTESQYVLPDTIVP